MEIVQLLIDILKFVGVLVGVVLGAALGVEAAQAPMRLGRGAIRVASRRRVRQPFAEPPEWPPEGWALSLLVRLDEGEGVFHPAVQVRGGGERRGGRIRLELVDPEGAVRLVVNRAFPAAALNTELPLPSFAPPEGASPDEVLTWHWDVILSVERSELRWREHPSAPGGLNAEAELRGEGDGAPVEPLGERLAAGVGRSDLAARMRANPLRRLVKLDEERTLRWLADQLEAGNADDLDLDELAAQVLGGEPEPSAIQQLRDVLGGAPDEPTRLAAGRLIYSSSTLDDSVLAAARPAVSGALARGMRSGDLRARAACLWAVNKLGGGNAQEAIAGVLPESDEDGRFEIVRILGFRGDRRATPALVEALAREPSAKIRSAILWALGTLADPAALQPCIDALDDRNAETRGYAAWALGQIHDPAALSALREALSDPDPDARGWVEEAVGMLESSLPTCR